MGKQRLNSAGYTVLVLSVLTVLATVAAATGVITSLQGKSQIKQLKNIGTTTQGLLKDSIVKNDAQAVEMEKREVEQRRQQEVMNQLVENAIRNVQLNTATSVDCIFLRDHGIRPTPCREVNARIDLLQGGVPLMVSTTSTTLPSSVTTSTTRVLPSTAPPTTTTQPPTPCRGISLIGICIGG